MKVITQLIRHFWQEGALAPAQVEHLIDHGFIRPKDLIGYRSPDAQEDTWIEAEESPLIEPDALDHWEDRLALPRRRAKGRKGPRVKVLETADLIARIEELLEQRQDCLPHLITFGAEFGPSDCWEGGLERIRQAAPRDFASRFAQLLQRKPGRLLDLWRALDFDPFHRLVRDHELRGRAAQAYAALLVGNPAHLGKYAWILAYDQMQVVLNLRHASDLLLRGLAQMLRQVPHVLTKALSAGCAPSAFWALVLLHNAGRTTGDEFDLAVEYGPLAPPQPAIWEQAWSAALRMEPQPVTQFLIACYADADERQNRSAVRCGRTLYCPTGWHVPSGV